MSAIWTPSPTLWTPRPWWRLPRFLPEWLTAGKAQRDPTSGKCKRKANGKVAANGASNDKCCCEETCDGYSCGYCSGGTPNQYTVTFYDVEIQKTCLISNGTSVTMATNGDCSAGWGLGTITATQVGSSTPCAFSGKVCPSTPPNYRYSITTDCATPYSFVDLRLELLRTSLTTVTLKVGNINLTPYMYLFDATATVASGACYDTIEFTNINTSFAVVDKTGDHLFRANMGKNGTAIATPC